MNTLLGYLTAVPAPLAYAVIGGLVFAEAALFFGFVIPGETAVIIGAVLAALGHLNVAVLLLLVIGAAVIGDSVGYEIGKKLQVERNEFLDQVFKGWNPARVRGGNQ